MAKATIVLFVVMIMAFAVWKVSTNDTYERGTGAIPCKLNNPIFSFLTQNDGTPNGMILENITGKPVSVKSAKQIIFVDDEIIAEKRLFDFTIDSHEEREILLVPTLNRRDFKRFAQQPSGLVSYGNKIEVCRADGICDEIAGTFHIKIE